MEKQDLREYSDSELSLHVYNDEFLYKNRFRRHLKELLDETFIYSSEQWEVLENDLNDERLENEN